MIKSAIVKKNKQINFRRIWKRLNLTRRLSLVNEGKEKFFRKVNVVVPAKINIKENDVTY